MKARTKLSVLFAAIAWLVSPASSHAAELWRDGDRFLDASGSIRELLTVTNGTEGSRFNRSVLANGCLDPARFVNCPAFDQIGDRDVWQSLARLRLKLDAGFGNGWSGQLTYDAEWRAVSSTDYSPFPVPWKIPFSVSKTVSARLQVATNRCTGSTGLAALRAGSTPDHGRSPTHSVGRRPPVESDRSFQCHRSPRGRKRSVAGDRRGRRALVVLGASTNCSSSTRRPRDPPTRAMRCAIRP